VAAAIEGYASHTSVVAGDFIDFHVRADDAHRHFTIDIIRRGHEDTHVANAAGEAFVPGPQNDGDLAIHGCAWPPALGVRTTIPPEWKSGYYVARLSSGNASAGIPFIVRSATPGDTAPILLKMSDTTVQAYNTWGDRSFYAGFSPNISFDRPYQSVPNFEKYQRPFLAWAELHGFELDYCSSLDLHSNPDLLSPYRLLISIGHDEYWSKEMRDHAEQFIEDGGNVCFFSANTCYWNTRLDLGNGRRIMTCYKESENAPPKIVRPPDPQRDPERLTIRWYEPPVNRPENHLTGVSFRNGAGWFDGSPPTASRFQGYSATDTSHWVYEGSGLKNGDIFGHGTSEETTVLGYETDAAELIPGSNPPRVTGHDGTPTDFHVLATANLHDWHGQGGHATMGMYQRNGTVFTAATINWAAGLAPDSHPPVGAITGNLLRRLTS
jgi:N,N-dimethylformamidase beta subunit-like, C-terminal